MLNTCCAPTKAFLPKPTLEIRLPLLDEVSLKLPEVLQPSRGFSHVANMLALSNARTCAVCCVLSKVSTIKLSTLHRFLCCLSCLKAGSKLHRIKLELLKSTWYSKSYVVFLLCSLEEHVALRGSNSLQRNQDNTAELFWEVTTNDLNSLLLPVFLSRLFLAMTSLPPSFLFAPKPVVEVLRKVWSVDSFWALGTFDNDSLGHHSVFVEDLECDGA